MPPRRSESVSLDGSAQWNVTADSHVSVLMNEQQDCTNIQSNGYTIYYDQDNKENSWLGGKTIALPGGGSCGRNNTANRKKPMPYHMAFFMDMGRRNFPPAQSRRNILKRESRNQAPSRVLK